MLVFNFPEIQYVRWPSVEERGSALKRSRRSVVEGTNVASRRGIVVS